MLSTGKGRKAFAAFAAVVIACAVALNVAPPAPAWAEGPVAQVIGADGMVVKECSNVSKFNTACNKLASGETMKLLSDIELNSTNYRPTIKGADVTLDLNGFSITTTDSTSAYAIQVGAYSPASTVTIKNGSIVTERGSAIKELKNASLVLENVVLSGSTFGVELGSATKSASTLVVNGDNTQISGGVAGIAFFGSTDGQSKLIVNAGTISGGYYGIAGQGDPNKYGPTEIVINGGTVKGTNADDSTGIYHPQLGTLTIAGGAISGATGIEMRAGELSVTGGTVTGTGAYAVSPNGNGSTTTGAAIAIAQHTTQQIVKVTVSGGTFEAEKAISEANPQNNASPDITLDVTAGSFKGDIVSVDCDEFISGGSFDRPVATAQLVAGVAEAGVDGTYVVGAPNTVKTAAESAKTSVDVVAGVSELTLSEGVKVTNSTGSDITVNGSKLPAGTTEPAPHVHNAVKVPAKAATAEAEGNIEYWYCEGCDKCFSDEALTKEIAKADTVLPKLEPQKIVVTFNDAFGNKTTVHVAKGATAAKPADPTHDGYKFVAWFVDKGCTQEYDFSKPVTADLELWAKWSKVEKADEENKNGLPQTGDPTAVVSVVGVAGAALAAAGVIANRKRK